MLLENCSYPRDVRVSREARALVAAGHEVTVIAPRAAGESRRETIDGVAVRRFRVPIQGVTARGTALEYAVAIPALHLAALRALARGLTVLHLHNPPDLLFGAGLAARLLRRAVVYDQHDLFPELVAHKLGPGRAVRLAAAAERASFAVCTHVLAANESQAEVARIRGRVPAERVTVVRNGPPRATIVAGPAGRSGPLRDPELIYVGLLASQDGADALAGVLARVRRRRQTPDARLVVVGDGEERATLEAALRAEGVAHCATLTGWVSADEVRRRLAAADICVDPSPATALNERSTMIKIGEYLAAGKPVVAYDLIETRRSAGGAARLVAAGDAEAMADEIARLAGEPAARAKLAGAGLRRAHQVSWEHSVAALLAAYEAL